MIRQCLPFLLLAGCATPAERAAQGQARADRDAARLATMLEGLEPAETRACLDTVGRSFSTDVVGPAIVYRETRGRIWVTQTSGGCAANGGDPILVTRQFSGQLCRGDIVRAVDRSGGMLVGSCAVGDFTLHTRPMGVQG